MESFLSSASLVLFGVLAALFVAGFFYPKMTRDWRVHLANGICLVAIAVCNLLNLLMYKQKASLGDGFWLAVYVILAVVCFGAARKLYRVSYNKKVK